VEYVQGYAIHTPCPLEELIRMTSGKHADAAPIIFEESGSK